MLMFWCVENGHTKIYVGKYGKEFSFRCVCRDRVPAKALLLWEGGAENGHTGICVEKYEKNLVSGAFAGIGFPQKLCFCGREEQRRST